MLRALLLVSLLGLTPALRAADAPAFTWEETDGSVALLHGSQTVWRYRYGPTQPKPAFHPVAVVGGPNLTWFRPADHRWHRGLWFSWKYINGVNYWEEDPESGQSAGRTETLETRVATRRDFGARIFQKLQYCPGDGEPVLAEERLIEISPPDAEGSWTLEWVLTFRALETVRLDRTPLPHEPGGQIFGGYAGLSMRFSSALEQVEVATTSGPVTFHDDRFRGKSIGMDYSGTVEGTPFGVAILDHQKNLNSPSPWYAINGPVMRYFSPAVICYAPHTLEAGESLTLRYRVVVHPGRWDADRLFYEARRHGEGR